MCVFVVMVGLLVCFCSIVFDCYVMIFFNYCVQGFDNDEVVFDWFVIDVIEIVWLCMCFFVLQGDVVLQWYSFCLLFVVVIVGYGVDVVFVKWYYVIVCSVVILQEEYGFIDYFVIWGVLVVLLLCDWDGVIVVEYVGWMYELYCVGYGVDLYCDVLFWILLIDVGYVCEVGCVFVELYQVVVGYIVVQWGIYLLVVCDDLICVCDLFVVFVVQLDECFVFVDYLVGIVWQDDLQCDLLFWYVCVGVCLDQEL